MSNTSLLQTEEDIVKHIRKLTLELKKFLIDEYNIEEFMLIPRKDTQKVNKNIIYIFNKYGNNDVSLKDSIIVKITDIIREFCTKLIENLKSKKKLLVTTVFLV